MANTNTLRKERKGQLRVPAHGSRSGVESLVLYEENVFPSRAGVE